MPTLKQRKSEQDAWECFAKHLGIELEDIRERAGDGLLSQGKNKASVPAWLRDLILAKTTWRSAESSVTTIKSAG